MTDLEMLKKITGESDDDLLSLLLAMAEEKVAMHLLQDFLKLF